MKVIVENFLNQKYGLGRDMEEVHYGGEGLHWAVVPMKKQLIELTKLWHYPNSFCNFYTIHCRKYAVCIVSFKGENKLF